MLKKIEKLLERKFAAIAVIAFVTLIIYSNSFSAPFTLDDFGSIVNNYSIRNPFDLFSIWEFYSNRFILYFTISINYFIHDGGVEGYHITNVALHIFNGFLVFCILLRILGLEYFRKEFLYKYRRSISLLSALVFTCHPVQVNAVTYIIQRTAALAATFYFLSILFYLKFRIQNGIKYFLLTLLFTIAAMFTKENTITIPFLLAFIEFLFFLGDWKTTWKKRLLFLLILFLTVPIIPATNLYLGGHSQSDPGVSFKASTSMDRFEYFYTELNVIVRYIKLLFIPDNLNFDYSNDFTRSRSIWENHSYISFIILSIIGLFGIFNIRRNKLAALGIVWFFTGLAVESSFISIKDVYFEHRLYFPVVGFVLFLVGIIFSKYRARGRIYTTRRPQLLFTVVFCFMIVFFSIITLYRNYIFSDGVRLWTDVAKKAPNSDRAHSVLATNYLDRYELSSSKNENDLQMAEQEFKQAIKLYNNNDTAHCNLSKVYLLRKEYEDCIYEARTALIWSESVYAYNNIGMAYLGLNKPDEALDAFLSGYKADNRCTFILKALGNLYYDRGDYENAKYYYGEFLKYNDYPDSKEIKEKLKTIP